MKNTFTGDATASRENWEKLWKYPIKSPDSHHELLKNVLQVADIHDAKSLRLVAEGELIVLNFPYSVLMFIQRIIH